MVDVQVGMRAGSRQSLHGPSHTHPDGNPLIKTRILALINTGNVARAVDSQRTYLTILKSVPSWPPDSAVSALSCYLEHSAQWLGFVFVILDSELCFPWLVEIYCIQSPLRVSASILFCQSPR